MAAVAVAVTALVLGACSDGTNPGETTSSSSSAVSSGAGGSGGSATTASGGSTSSMSAGASASSSSSSSSSSSITSVASSSTGPSFKCGNGICEPPAETPVFCPQDCNSTSSGNGGSGGNGAGGSGGAPPVPCPHDVCDQGDQLDAACGACAAAVCAQDGFCCNDSWDGMCVAEADTLCNAGCCGNGVCNGGEDCAACPDDCGACPSPPTCEHSVCATGPQSAPLDPTQCLDPCVDTVCATKPSCCQENGWTGDCQALASACGGDPCVAAVCAALPACCAVAWTADCVIQAMTTCPTGCSCSHSVCAEGEKLDATCEPCATSVCKVDGYCCDSAWDGTCVGEVATVCGIKCN